MLADTRIILRHHPYEVHAQRHEVMWRDGSAVALHPVWAHGMPMLMLRALELEPWRFHLFDLGKLHPPLGRALPATPQRDVIGHVFFTLRAEYPCAAAFAAEVYRTRLGTWSAVHGSDELAWLAATTPPATTAKSLAALAAAMPRGPVGQRIAA